MSAWAVETNDLVVESGNRPPLVLVVPEMAQEKLVEHRAGHFIRTVGETALMVTVEVEPSQETQPQSLMEAAKLAARGHSGAIKMLNMNASTDVIERTIKAGHVIKVAMERDDEGRLLQHGQTLDSVHANALFYASDDPDIRLRSEAETRNKFRIENLDREGLLEDYCLVVFSRCLEDKTDKELDELGFFAETKSCAIQLTTAENGQITTESAFVAGVAKPGAEQHDVAAINGLAAELGVDYTGKTSTEIIDTPVLIHKSLIPNGVIDIVAWYDRIVGGTFFGEAKPAQDYLEFLEVCRQREKDFQPTVQKIVKQLILEADSINTPVEAIERLHQLSQDYTVEQAIEDTTINPRVFGAEAAAHIEVARLHQQLGNTELAMQALKSAKDTATSSSCPTKLKKSERDFSDLIPDQLEDKADSEEEGESSHGLIRCINCRKSVPKEKVVKKDCWKCPKCQYKVDICNGAVLDAGNLDEKPRVSTKLMELFAPKVENEKQTA